jgi:hypothetical protein
MKATIKINMGPAIITAAFVAFASLSIFSSCKKSGPADAVVSVRTASGAKVQGALVVLRQDSVKSPVSGIKANVHQAQITDFNGQAYFSFQYEAILNVEVSKDTFLVKDFIKLEQSEQVEKLVILK